MKSLQSVFEKGLNIDRSIIVESRMKQLVVKPKKINDILYKINSFELNDWSLSVLDGNIKDLLGQTIDLTSLKFEPFKKIFPSEFIKFDKWNDRDKVQMVPLFGYGTSTKSPFVLITFHKGEHISFICRHSDDYLARAKKEKSMKFDRRSAKKWLLNNSGNLEFRRKYKYTDDYAHDAHTNFGKFDWSPLSDDRIKTFIKDFDYGYSVSGKIGDNLLGIFSGWESFEVRLNPKNLDK